MALRTLVKVGNITNLSDARYCAGMGVEMLGFDTVNTSTSYLSPQSFQEIRGWISGPLIVAQIHGISTTQAIREVLEAYQPDFVELGVKELSLLPDGFSTKLILRIEALSLSEPTPAAVSYFLLAEELLSTTHTDPKKTIVTLSSSGELSTLIDKGYAGVALTGTAEVRPGFKEYGELADVLEQLEVD